MAKFKILITIDAKIAIPKLEITNASPISSAVIINVIALMINKKKPNVMTVTGNVKITRIGFKMMLMIDKRTLAKMAADALSK